MSSLSAKGIRSLCWKVGGIFAHSRRYVFPLLFSLTVSLLDCIDENFDVRVTALGAGPEIIFHRGRNGASARELVREKESASLPYFSRETNTWSPKLFHSAELTCTLYHDSKLLRTYAGSLYIQLRDSFLFLGAWDRIYNL